MNVTPWLLTCNMPGGHVHLFTWTAGNTPPPWIYQIQKKIIEIEIFQVGQLLLLTNHLSGSCSYFDRPN